METQSQPELTQPVEVVKMKMKEVVDAPIDAPVKPVLSLDWLTYAEAEMIACWGESGLEGRLGTY